MKVFCYHGNKSTILLFYSIFRTTLEVSSKLYFVEICQVSEKLWLFNHKRADFWLPNFGFKRSLLSLLKFVSHKSKVEIMKKKKHGKNSRVSKDLSAGTRKMLNEIYAKKDALGVEGLDTCCLILKEF